MSDPVLVRPARESDVGYIVGTWRDSYASAPAVAGADRDAYRAEVARIVSRLRATPEATLRVACDREDEDTLVGFAAFTGSTLHYVYVRGDMRQMGIAKRLIEGATIAHYTFRTLAGERRLRAAERGWKFTPRFTL